MLVTIAAGDVGPEYHGTKVPAFARLYPNAQYTTSDGLIIEKGSPSNPNGFYYEFTCSLVSQRIRINTAVVNSSTDSNKPDVGHTLVIFDSNGKQITTLFTNLKIGVTTPTTWQNLEELSSARILREAPSYYTGAVTDRRFSELINMALKASEVQWGAVRLDVPATDLANPIALGLNTPLLAPATVGALGRLRIDTAPLDPNNPTAVGTENPKFKALDQIIIDQDKQTKYLSGYANLNAAIVAIGATPTELKVTSAYSLTTTETLPNNINLTFEGNGKITVAAGQTLIIGLMRDPGNKQVLVQADATANIRFARNAVESINLAWLVGPASGATITNALTQALASCLTNGGGNIYVPEGTWLTAGNHSVPSRTYIYGAGNYVDATSAPTIVRAAATGVPIFKMANPNVHQITFDALVIDGNNLANVDGFYGTGSEVAGDYAGEIRFNKITVTNCVHGVRFFSSAGAWLVRAIEILGCNFTNNQTDYRINTSNNQNLISMTNFGATAGNYNLLFESVGNTLITGCEFFGLPGYFGTRQVISNQVAAPAGITGSGNAKVVISGISGFNGGANYTVYIPVTTALTTASQIATQIRTYLKADDKVYNFFGVGGSTDRIELTFLVPDDNEAAANFTIEDDTSAGISDSLSSGIDTAGVARTGMAEGVCHITGQHGTIHFQNCQDEAYKYFIVNDASDIESPITISASLVQAEILLNQTCAIEVGGATKLLSRTFIEGTTNSSRIHLGEHYVRPYDAYGNAFVPAEVGGLFTGVIITKDDPLGFDKRTTFRQPLDIFATIVDDNKPTIPLMALGYKTAVSADRCIAKWGRTNTRGEFEQYAEMKWIYALSRTQFNASVGDFQFTKDVTVPDDAYHATNWNGNLAVPTKNGVRDKIEAMFAGMTFTGPVIATRLSSSVSTVVTPGATPSINAALGNDFTLTPGEDETISITGMVAGQDIYLRITTSGTTPRTLTFGTGFKVTGTLSTGAVSGKVFEMHFRSDGTTATEVSRTAAM